jgi:hypothetical protein
VHSRLHTEALNKQKIDRRQRDKFNGVSYEASSLLNNSYSSKRPNRGREMLPKSHTARNRTPQNYGEKLYQNGLKKLEEKERQHQKEKLEREMNEIENLSFRPQINSQNKHHSRLNNKRLEDRLIEKGKKSNDMIEKKRSEMLFEQQHRHSFKPQINKKSARIVMERSKQFMEESHEMSRNDAPDSSFMSLNGKLDKFKLLYDDAIKRKQRKDQIYSKCLDSECTFQPELMRSPLTSYYTESGSFVERLSKPSKLKEKSKIKYLQDERFDKETGQPFFHPKVGRPPLARRNMENVPVTEKLYIEGRMKQEEKEFKRQEAEHEKKRKANIKAAYDRSEELVEQKKARKFHEIFMMLDSDGDGVISAEHIDISRLGPDILEIFTPLL